MKVCMFKIVVITIQTKFFCHLTCPFIVLCMIATIPNISNDVLVRINYRSFMLRKFKKAGKAGYVVPSNFRQGLKSYLIQI